MFVFDGKKLRRMRKARRWSLGDLARALQGGGNLKASSALVHGWEHGTRPSGGYLAALCVLFACPINDFAKDNEVPIPEIIA